MKIGGEGKRVGARWYGMGSVLGGRGGRSLQERGDKDFAAVVAYIGQFCFLQHLLKGGAKLTEVGTCTWSELPTSVHHIIPRYMYKMNLKLSLNGTCKDTITTKHCKQKMPFQGQVTC